MRKLFAGIIISTFALPGIGPISCDSPSIANKVLPAKTKSPIVVAQASGAGELTALEQSVHQQINQYRQSRNLSNLSLDPRISEQARAHSQAMANGEVPFSHAGFEQRVQVIGRVIPYIQTAENVAFNKGYKNPDKQAVEGWIKSPGHRTNIEGQYNLTGVGVAKNAKGEYYLTQIFIRSWQLPF